MLVSSTIIMWGDDLDPTRVTNFVGIEPSRSGRRGEKVQSKGKIDLIEKTGRWSLSSKEKISSLSINEHIEFFRINFFELLSKNSTKYGIQKCRLSFIIDEINLDEIQSWSDEIDPSYLTCLSDMNISLSVSVLFPESGNNEI